MGTGACPVAVPMRGSRVRGHGRDRGRTRCRALSGSEREHVLERKSVRDPESIEEVRNNGTDAALTARRPAIDNRKGCGDSDDDDVLVDDIDASATSGHPTRSTAQKAVMRVPSGKDEPATQSGQRRRRQPGDEKTADTNKPAATRPSRTPRASSKVRKAWQPTALAFSNGTPRNPDARPPARAGRRGDTAAVGGATAKLGSAARAPNGRRARGAPRRPGTVQAQPTADPPHIYSRHVVSRRAGLWPPGRPAWSARFRGSGRIRCPRGSFAALSALQGVRCLWVRGVELPALPLTSRPGFGVLQRSAFRAVWFSGASPVLLTAPEVVVAGIVLAAGFQRGAGKNRPLDAATRPRTGPGTALGPLPAVFVSEKVPKA